MAESLSNPGQIVSQNYAKLSDNKNAHLSHSSIGYVCAAGIVGETVN
jgi:hypothetical protein